MNALYSGKSASSSGTLYQIRNKFGHRSVKAKITNCVNSVVDLFNFTTEGFVTLLACDMLSLESVEDNPVDLPHNQLERYVYVDNISEKIVEFVSPTIDSNVFGEDLDETLLYDDDMDIVRENYYDTLTSEDDDEEAEYMPVDVEEGTFN